MKLYRAMRHLLIPPWQARLTFGASTLDAIEAAIRKSEANHHGQICFAVEAALEVQALWRGQSARERALEVFGQVRAWDTEHNNGVLIYVLLADHDVEILADRGLARRVAAETWTGICAEMEKAFRAGHYEAGAVAGIEAIGALLVEHFPGRRANELPDRPTIV